MKAFIVLALFTLGAGFSQAQEGSSSLQFGTEETRVEPLGLLPFLGLGTGYTGYENFQEAEGSPASIKLLGSWYLMQPVVFDVGYGIGNQQFIHDTAAEASRTNGVAEIAVRWAAPGRWQVGVVADHFFDQGAAYAADQADAQFVGLQVLKEFDTSPSWLARVGARAQSLTNNTDGLVMMYLVDLQLGWNPSAQRPSVQSAADEPRTEESLQEAMEEPQAPPFSRAASDTVASSNSEELNYRNIAGENGAITFSSATASVSSKDQARLNKIARVLSENPDLVERVEVRGYADASGSEQINDRISQQRAVNVRTALQRSGLNDVDIVAVGRGASDSERVSAEDRRADLIFIGVKDEKALRNALSEIE